MLISHHRLEGKIVALPKPFAVLEKKRRRSVLEESEQIEPQKKVDLASSPLRYSRVNQQGKEDDDEEGVEMLKDAEGPASPSMARKRAKRENGDALYQKTPVKALKRAPIDTSSSPMPRAPLRGSELDFSSPLPISKRTAASGVGETEEEQDWMYKKKTSTYFEVVCIIRNKILFTKRPEPVVRLDGEGGQQARIALGLETS